MSMTPTQLMSQSRWATFVLVFIVVVMAAVVDCKEIDSKSDLLQEESMSIPAEHRTFADLDIPGDLMARKNVGQHVKYEPSTNEVWPYSRSEASQIKAINVKCEKNLMKVNIEFDRPFNGLVFSKGHYSDPKCVHLPAGTGQLQANFEIFLGSCGMTSSEQTGTASTSAGLFIENTIIVQYDPQVQEIWDQARRLRCTWWDFYEKQISFRPFNVDMLDAVTANFLGDNIQCWMQIQVGKGPWASEVAGIVKIGQTMTMVLAIKDEENKFDMLVRNCIAHDGKHQPIQLVDEFGCIVRSKIMSRFQKVKNFGNSATVVSYAYFQAFKFPDSMNVHFQCVIQVCRSECPQPTCENDSANGEFMGNARDGGPFHPDDKKFTNRIGNIQARRMNSNTTSPNVTGRSERNDHYLLGGTGGMPRSLNLNKLRRRRAVPQTDVSTQKMIQVVAPGDVAFNLPLSGPDGVVQSGDVVQRKISEDHGNVICMSTTGFVAGLVFLILLLLLTCIITVFLVIRLRNLSSSSSKEHQMSVSLHCPHHPNTACGCELSLVQPQYYVQIPAMHIGNVAS